MNILVTGARGFVGKNLCANLKNIAQGKNRTRPGLSIGEIYEYDRGTDPELLDEYCEKADFVYHLAGVNRPKEPGEFQEGNVRFTSVLLETLKKHRNSCPVMLASSIQAALLGRYASSDYGRSKLAAEKLLFSYSEEIQAPVLVYRLPNLFGKWCRPNYNSVVSTFCHNIAEGLPVTVSNPDTELELLYIDDLLEELLDALEGKPHRCNYDGLNPVFTEEGRYCAAPVTAHVTLGRIVELLNSFHDLPQTRMIPQMPENSFEKKLCSTYLSCLPRKKMTFPMPTKSDERGSFTELLHTENCGQFSVNLSKPGAVKGQHWHNSKWEFFMVVSGHGLIQERRIGSEEVRSFEVSGDRMEAVAMLPGFTHNIINLSDTENLVTVMWANENFDPNRPDTFSEPVE